VFWLCFVLCHIASVALQCALTRVALQQLCASHVSAAGLSFQWVRCLCNVLGKVVNQAMAAQY